MKEFVYRVLASLGETPVILTKAQLTDYVFDYAQRVGTSTPQPSAVVSAVNTVVRRLMVEGLGAKVGAKGYRFSSSEVYAERAGDWRRDTPGDVAFLFPSSSSLPVLPRSENVSQSEAKTDGLPKTMRDWAASDGILCVDKTELERLIASQDEAL